MQDDHDPRDTGQQQNDKRKGEFKPPKQPAGPYDTDDSGGKVDRQGLPDDESKFGLSAIHTSTSHTSHTSMHSVESEHEGLRKTRRRHAAPRDKTRLTLAALPHEDFVELQASASGGMMSCTDGTVRRLLHSSSESRC